MPNESFRMRGVITLLQVDKQLSWSSSLLDDRVLISKITKMDLEKRLEAQQAKADVMSQTGGSPERGSFETEFQVTIC